MRGEQTNHPEVFEAHSPSAAGWTEVENVLAQSYGRGVVGGACDFLQLPDLMTSSPLA